MDGKHKENVHSGPFPEQPKLLPREVESGRLLSQSVSQHGYDGGRFETPTIHVPRSPAANHDSSPNGHDSTSRGITPFSPYTQYPEESENVQDPTSSFQEELLKTKAEMEGFKYMIKKLEEDAKEKDKQLNEYKQNIDELEKEKEKEAYENKMKELRGENEEFKRKYKRAESEIKELSCRVAKVEDEQKKMKARHQSLEAQLQEQNKRFREKSKMQQLEQDNTMLRVAADVDRMTLELQGERLKRAQKLGKENEELKSENQELRRKSEAQKD